MARSSGLLENGNWIDYRSDIVFRDNLLRFKFTEIRLNGVDAVSKIVGNTIEAIIKEEMLEVEMLGVEKIGVKRNSELVKIYDDDKRKVLVM